MILQYPEHLGTGLVQRKLTKKYEVEVRGRLGPDAEDDELIRILNRVVSWTEQGIEHEAEQRLSEIIVRDLGLQSSKGLSTPGVRLAREEIDNMEKEEICEYMCTEHRALVARANYLCQNRLDIMYAAKDLGRDMPAPKDTNLRARKGVGKIPQTKPQVHTQV